MGEKKYRLGPFLVGWYEAMMRLQDKEFAELFEQFVIEGGGERIFAPRPGVLGVVPVRGSLKPEYIEREPHLDIDAHFQRHERFLVIPCVCKREMELPARAQLPEADEAMRLRRAAAADPARRDRARPGGGLDAPHEAREDGARPPRVLRLHHERGVAAVCRHVQLLLLLLRDLPRPEDAGRRCGRARRSRTTAPSSIPSLHGLRRLHPPLPGGRHLRGPRSPEAARSSWSTARATSRSGCPARPSWWTATSASAAGCA